MFGYKKEQQGTKRRKRDEKGLFHRTIYGASTGYVRSMVEGKPAVDCESEERGRAKWGSVLACYSFLSFLISLSVGVSTDRNNHSS